MEVRGELQTPAVLLPGKNPLLSKRVSGPRANVYSPVKRKISLLNFKIKSFMICTSQKIFFQAIKSQRTAARECGMYGGEERCISGFGGET